MRVGVLSQQARPGSLAEHATTGLISGEPAVRVDCLFGTVDYQDLSAWLEPFFNSQIGIADHGAAKRGKLERAGGGRCVDARVSLASDQQVDPTSAAVV